MSETVCPKCGKCYEDVSEEFANEPGRLCMSCWTAERKGLYLRRHALLLKITSLIVDHEDSTDDLNRVGCLMQFLDDKSSIEFEFDGEKFCERSIQIREHVHISREGDDDSNVSKKETKPRS